MEQDDNKPSDLHSDNDDIPDYVRDMLATGYIAIRVYPVPPVSETEKRLRQDEARYREMARMAQGEREASVRAAVRDRDAAVMTVQTDAFARVLRADMRVAGLQAGILDLDALRLADNSAVRVGDDGELVGVAEAVAALREAKPYLFGPAQ